MFLIEYGCARRARESEAGKLYGSGSTP